jgi:hypothetical protein
MKTENGGGMLGIDQKCSLFPGSFITYPRGYVLLNGHQKQAGLSLDN